jgi:glycyl-tRNA synthetase beta chain
VDYAVEVARVRSTADFEALAEAFKRANNIVDDAWGSDAAAARVEPRMDRLHEPAELALRASLTRIGAEMRAHLDALNPRSALMSMATIRGELDRFFSEVRVNVDDEQLREARLALLAELRDLIREIGDISQIARKRPD